MAKVSNLDLEVIDVKQMMVSADPSEGAVITVEIVGEQLVDIHLSPHALAKLEAFLARANVEQAKHVPMQ
ncbi:hypothetical protein [Bosea sp. BK604]|uniref:hypothetical protein n=1 Tax=Bosea sp. BK604 TaxID=2512180 RepID=UPI001050D726|nr:hypothetical protein [Bosea sp. BK604]TCR65668.1 hypothetical protein EV560_105431 [Bosea sp. BK604]